MTHHSILATFFHRVIPDEKINTTHISIYLLFYQYWNDNQFHSPIKISRADVMKKTKISSKATYHKCIKDLHAQGYIIYSPSYHPVHGSKVFMAHLDSEMILR